ncbi:MAG: NAD(P)-dependent oxidoreductase [Gemmatimonadota bacterium]|nr:NAD(P)-dependent oxidoreductase [Gemmatimonadota bacterium]
MRALVGYTGFVGGNLASQAEFDATFNTRNIESIRGRAFTLGVCAAAPAEKWKANLDPDADRASIRRLIDDLDAARFERFVLISTVDVYPEPREVDEESPISVESSSPYGRHRRELEMFVRDRFDATILRLPALFGPGLKKNAVYDLLHDNMVDRIDSRAVFQFYDLGNVWRDVRRTLELGIATLNVATEPVSMAEVALEAFGIEFENHVAETPPRYDFRSRHGRSWGREDGYLYGRRNVLEGLRRFVVAERAGGGGST